MILTCTSCIVVFVVVCGAVALGDYSEAGFILFLFTTAEWLETLASRKVSCLNFFIYSKKM